MQGRSRTVKKTFEIGRGIWYSPVLWPTQLALFDLAGRRTDTCFLVFRSVLNTDKRVCS